MVARRACPRERRRVPGSRWAVVVLAWCLAGSVPAPATAQNGAAKQPGVKVTLDRSTVAPNETFKVRFAVEGGKLAAPDWSPLKKDFHVRSATPGGRGWDVRLQPKRAGKLRIPPLQFGALRSRAVQLTVKQPAPPRKQKPAEEFFVEVNAKPENPYVQAQVLFTLRVFMLHGLRGSVTTPQSDNKIVVEGLGDARRYRTKRAGRNYEVYERRYLIYPQSSGDIKLKPVKVTGTYTKQGRRHRLNKPSRVLTLRVRRVPASFPGRFWLPAESFKVRESWSSDLSQWRAGEPFTRTLDLEANGLLARQVPEVDLSVNDGFRFYTESADFKNKRHKDTNVGNRRQSAVLIPARPGTYTLPAVQVPWWNTRADRLEIAELPAREVTISEAAFSELTVDEPPPAADTGEETGLRPAALAVETGSPWFWASIFLSLGWLATTAVTWRGRGLHRLVLAVLRRRRTLRESRKAIERACRNNDAVAARDALMQWARQTWPDDAPTSLGKVGARFRSKGGGTSGDPGGDAPGDNAVGRQIARLERALYARDDKWQGSLLGDALREAFSSRGFVFRGRRRARAGGLEPLHRL